MVHSQWPTAGGAAPGHKFQGLEVCGRQISSPCSCDRQNTCCRRGRKIIKNSFWLAVKGDGRLSSLTKRNGELIHVHLMGWAGAVECFAGPGLDKK